jgi:hypothetical protein
MEHRPTDSARSQLPTLQVQWHSGPRTSAWRGLWRRILTDMLSAGRFPWTPIGAPHHSDAAQLQAPQTAEPIISAARDGCSAPIGDEEGDTDALSV